MYVKGHKRKGKSVKAYTRRDGQRGWHMVGGKLYRRRSFPSVKPSGAEIIQKKEEKVIPVDIPYTQEHQSVLYDFATFDTTGSPAKAAKYLKERLGKKITAKQASHIANRHYSSLHSDINVDPN